MRIAPVASLAVALFTFLASVSAGDEATDSKAVFGNLRLASPFLTQIFPGDMRELRVLWDKRINGPTVWIVGPEALPPDAVLKWYGGNRERLNAYDYSFILVSATSQQDFERLEDKLYLAADDDGHFARAFRLGSPEGPALAIAITDDDGILRYVEALTEPELGKVAPSLSGYQQGQSIYNAHCARCHGGDGRATGYPFIRKLRGLGNRMTYDEIIEATEATGVVDMGQFTDAEREAMAKYVAGL